MNVSRLVGRLDLKGVIGMDIPVLETQRLRLVPPGERHFESYRAFYSDASASRYYGGPLAADGAWLKLARDVGHWHLRGYGMWMVETKACSTSVGGCGLYLNEGWRRPELTWWILPDARRKGYAREASDAVIEYGYRQLGWESVETYMLDTNEAARALTMALGAEKIGRETFPDGAMRDVFRFKNRWA